MKKAVVAVMKKDERLETDASNVDAALIEEHRLEAVAATDKALTSTKVPILTHSLVQKYKY